eukprot:6191533-Pleurochrysis_carterae.AAC.2
MDGQSVIPRDRGFRRLLWKIQQLARTADRVAVHTDGNLASVLAEQNLVHVHWMSASEQSLELMQKSSF